MAEISYGIEKILTPRSIASNLPSPKTTIAAGATTLGKANLPYLWAAKGRKRRRYWFYRRAGKLIPITSLEGRRLSPNEPGFGQIYDLIHEGFGAELQEHATGSLAHLIREYRASPEFKGLAPKSRTIYRRHLDLLEKHHGHRPISTLPREAVFKLRDEFQNTPSTANFVVTILRIILNYAEDRPKTFRLPPYWKNPAARPKRLKEGEGHRPWEEVEIAAFRKCWPIGTLQRTLLETFLNTGQRGTDIAPMIRRQYYQGEISVVQSKTGERIWIPAPRELRGALDPWLTNHTHVVLFPTRTGRSLNVANMRELMRRAIRQASLPDDCTLHGLRYTFATRGIELGLDWQTIESIVGHRTSEMGFKYTAKRRGARLAIATLDRNKSSTGEVDE